MILSRKKRRPSYRKAAVRPPTDLCTLTGMDSRPLAYGELLSPPDASVVQVRITEGSPEELLGCGNIRVIPQSAGPPWTGRVMQQQEQLLTLEPLPAQDGRALRVNLRMPVDFLSYGYPERSSRVAIRGHDLSSGGISFFCAHSFDVGDQLEVVIPITVPEPLVVPCRVLRKKPFPENVSQYGCEFVHMIHDQEKRIREAVFQVQIQRKSETMKARID